MLLGFRIVGGVAFALLLSACDWLIDPPPDVIYLISENFSGWICVDFEVENGPALPREGRAMVVRPRAGAVLETSEQKPGWRTEVWVEVGSERRPLPKDVRSGSEMSATGPNEPFQRVCRFVGTIDQEDAAGNPPGLDYGWFKTRPVPESERAALIALFEATGGEQWKHKAGWLGPAGTERNWHGVDCDSKYNESTTNLIGLDLYENNLRGSLPEAFGDLPHLKRLHVGGEGNLSGRLPAPLLRRWLSAELEVAGPGSLFTDISAIEIDSSDFSWCGGRRLVLRADGSASSIAERCGRLVPLSLWKHCELKTGGLYYQDFARLAHTIEQSSYFSLKAEYGRDVVTDQSLDVTRVTRNGQTHQVSDYASAGPQELWTISQAIYAVGNDVRWTDTKIQTDCPAR